MVLFEDFESHPDKIRYIALKQLRVLCDLRVSVVKKSWCLVDTLNRNLLFEYQLHELVEAATPCQPLVSSTLRHIPMGVDAGSLQLIVDSLRTEVLL